jgi:hypothetical protein
VRFRAIVPCLSLLLLAGCLAPSRSSQTGDPFEATLAAAGDIACEPGQARTRNACRMEDTARLVENADPEAVLVLGDAQYRRASLEEFRRSYHPSWGRFLSITRPVPGNHEYLTPGARDYFAYFGGRAGSPDQAWYAFELAGWRIYALNSNCEQVGGCGAGSPQYEWLRGELASDRSRCALAFWHHARFSSGPHGDQEPMAVIWELLDAHGVDVALSGHDHHYERFAPMTAAGIVDAEGIRQFVVGTGGSRHYPVFRRRAGSETAHSGAFGLLLLELRESGYSWRFEPVQGSSFVDTGSAPCR